MEFGREKIGMKTAFAYIFVRTDAAGGVGLYDYSSEPIKIVAELFRNYVLCLADSLCESNWHINVDAEDIGEVILYMEDRGFGEALEPVRKLIDETPEPRTPDELVEFGKKFRPLVNALGGAMDYLICRNIIEFLQFICRSEPDITMEELSERLDGAEFDCGEIE